MLKDEIKNKLSHAFDFQDDFVLDGYKFDLHAEFYQRNSKYFASKKLELYAYRNHEYIFYSYLDYLDENKFKEIIGVLEKNIGKIANPNEEHMSSMLTLIIECKDSDDFLSKQVQKYKFSKNFKFGFQGWAKIKILLINNNQKRVLESVFARGDAKKLKLLT